MFSSYRTKLQVAFLTLGFGSAAFIGWEASSWATTALRQATYDRLAAIRETRARQVERYFQDLSNHVLALSTDEATIAALEEFRAAWGELEPAVPGSPRYEALQRHYESTFAPRLAAGPEAKALASTWFPGDPRTGTLQYFFLASNPHPAGQRSHLLAPDGAGRYGEIHRRYHPTLFRYQSAFGFYDIFLIDARDRRILYTVLKEVDLGVEADVAPYSETTLARAVDRALSLDEPETFVVEDYAPYPPSYLAPAAFVAAPVWRAGVKTGVLAIQISVAEVNRVMTGDRRWREQGLGETGHAYIVGADGLLRSDVRPQIERPEEFYRRLPDSGLDAAIVEQVRRNGTAILTLPVSPELAASLRKDESGTGIATDTRGVETLRSYTPLNVAGLDWSLVAEIEAAEALAPVTALRQQILILGLLSAAVIFLAAHLLANSVTKPVLALAQGARRLGGRDFDARIAVKAEDEIGQLATSFNRMAEDLQRTTVSKEELQILNERLIASQEEERSRLARELHDDFTQRLAAVAIETGRIERLPPEAHNDARAALERIRHEIGALSRDIHGFSRRLHPSILDDLGLTAAVESSCRSFFEQGGAPVDFTTAGRVDEVSKEVQLTVYRVVQEALRNIYRHANADMVGVSLRLEADKVVVEITDDGRGFDRTAPEWRPGLGLASMAERARLLRGTLVVESKPGAGTTITMTLPVEESNGTSENTAGR